MGGAELEPGDVFAGYTIQRVLGVGGMGAVYLARDPHLPRNTALKLLDRSLTTDDCFRSRFELEADHAARLEHPNIVSVFDRGREANQHWIAMQYVAGTDAAVALREGPMDPPRAVHIVAETAKALDYAHENGVLHRDVKPANILLGMSGAGQLERVLLTDFGIAKALDETQHLTRTGSLVATLQYSAPEAFQGIPLDLRADVYSLGCTLFCLLTGHPPFTGSTQEVMRGHLCGPVPRISAVRGDLPPTFDDIVSAALTKRREDRLPSCHAFSAGVQLALSRMQSAQTAKQILTRRQTANVHAAPDTPTSRQPTPRRQGQQLPPPAPQPPPPQRNSVPPRRKRAGVLLALALLALLAVGAAVVFVSWPNRSATQTTLPFEGLDYPVGVAVNTAGDLVVADSNNNRVLRLAAGTGAQEVIPFTDLDHPSGVATNGAGDVFVADTRNNRVLELAAGATTQTVLPFTGLAGPAGVAVSDAGHLFVADNNNNRIVALPAGAASPQVLPLSDLHGPVGVAVNSGGDVFVTDTDNNRVLFLPAGATDQTVLPFTGLASPTGVAADSTGVFVADYGGGRVVALRAGADTPAVVPFTGLHGPIWVAVTATGDLVVTDGNRVLQLSGDG
ncbi:MULTISPECIES: serine/threonine-protein kinase PknD [unclassified Rhodococcus (in: high G+C Gram-positive bacteria)]|jgi:non-specific serine/threonine protein kinase/serine/threonine-protein kinase|uniref:serine/threonine-protein kinase PknD n=1 Tax=unclassified Rhodococcus (in: high G+C Gram-positive bacteria) TaxID=192944 RepID=UPI0002DEDE49|nr:serine/threonine-protein kinase PknD [Rhodococcus sp. DK17]